MWRPRLILALGKLIMAMQGLDKSKGKGNTGDACIRTKKHQFFVRVFLEQGFFVTQ
jgi:hypothetical protein